MRPPPTLEFGPKPARRPAMPRAGLVPCAFAAGLLGVALAVVLLSAYRNVRGYLYAEIGGITAGSMAALALGAPSP